MHLGAETNPALLCGARECAHDDVRAAAAGVEDLATDGAQPPTDPVAITAPPTARATMKPKRAGLVVLTLEAVVDG